MAPKSTLFALLMLSGLVAGCDTGPEAALPTDGPHALPSTGDAKADDYVSTTAREFELTGLAHVELPEDFDTLSPEARSSAVTRLVERRRSQVARAVRQHIEGVIRDANGGITGDDARFFTYFKSGAGQEAVGEVEVLEADEAGVRKARFGFTMEFVGSWYTMSQVSPETIGRSRRTFDITVKDHWADEAGEVVEVRIAGSESRDAFPRYDALFEDGVLDIALHFGGDYNEERHDLGTAKWTVEYLLDGGWEHPEAEAGYEGLTLESAPFTRAALIEGKEVEVRVYVYHAEMADAANAEKLAEKMRQSFAERDIVVYSGHAGPRAGFILDYHPRFEIPASAFKELPLADKYQIYAFDGCQTYRTYVDDLLKHPTKTLDKVDIITTVNTTPFSAGYQLIHELVYWLTLTDGAGNHFPVSWQALLRGLNTKDFRGVHYGVHGVDAGPKLNPHKSEGVACTPCSSDADCGAGGNLCLGYGAGGACGVACTTDTACGEGYRCARLFDDPDLFYLPKQCVRRDYVCL